MEDLSLIESLQICLARMDCCISLLQSIVAAFIGADDDVGQATLGTHFAKLQKLGLLANLSA